MTKAYEYGGVSLDATMAAILPSERWDPTRPPTEVQGPWGSVLEVSQYTLVRSIYTNPAVSRQIMDKRSIGDPGVHVLARGAWLQGRDLAEPLIEPVKEYYHRNAVGSLIGMVQHEADTIADRIAEEGSGVFEYNATYGNLPYQVAARMLGMDAGEDADLRRWLEVTAADQAGYHQQAATNSEMEVRFLSLIDEHDRTLGQGDQPRDPVDAYILAKRKQHEVGDRPIDDWWIVGQFGMLVSATAMTTKSQQGWNYMGFTEHGIWASLRRDPSIVTGAVREGMRMYPAFPTASGRADRDLVLGEGEHALSVEAGTVLNGLISAANHDPAVHPRPDQFDPLRTPSNRHLTLAWDWRYCIGGPLAETILSESALSTSRRFGNLALHGEPFKADVGLVATVPDDRLYFAYDPAAMAPRR